MQQDDMLWDCMKQGFCSFKIKTKTQILCKNDNNVVGICSKTACPLANSQYATIREHRGKVYLCKKVVERAAFPHKLWEKIPLPSNYEEALEKIDLELPYWIPKQVHRCKQRYTKIYEYLKRATKMATKMRQKKLITLPRKMERREKKREKKALNAAKLETQIEMEILNRVKQGVYGERYKFEDKHTFEKALREEEEEILKPSKKRKEVKEKPITLSKKYVEDIEDLDLNDEFADEEGDDFWASEDEEWEREEAQEKKKRKIHSQQLLTVEREE